MSFWKPAHERQSKESWFDNVLLWPPVISLCSLNWNFQMILTSSDSFANTLIYCHLWFLFNFCGTSTQLVFSDLDGLLNGYFLYYAQITSDNIFSTKKNNKKTAVDETIVRKSRNMKLFDVIVATAWQNQQNDLCTQRRLRSALASAQSDQSLRCLGSLATH